MSASCRRTSRVTARPDMGFTSLAVMLAGSWMGAKQVTEMTPAKSGAESQRPSSPMRRGWGDLACMLEPRGLPKLVR